MIKTLSILFAAIALSAHSQSISAIQTNLATFTLTVSYDPSLWPAITPLLLANGQQISPMPNTNPPPTFLTVSNSQGVFQLYVQTNTPTITDLGSQVGGRAWFSNGVLYVTGSTNGTTTYTKQLAP